MTSFSTGELSSIAIVGDGSPAAVKAGESVGASLISLERFQSAFLNGEAAADRRLDVVIIPTSRIVDLRESLVRLSRLNPQPNRIVVGPHTVQSSQSILETSEASSIFAWVESYESPDFQQQIMSALNQMQERRQANESLMMFLEHNKTLQKLSAELEARIEERRNELNDSTWRLQQTQRRSEIMHRALNAVHVSHSIPEIERLLVQILHPRNHSPTDAPAVEWVRITFNSQSRLESAPLDTRAGSVFSWSLGANGHIHFGRQPDRPFRSDDRSFLTPIAEAVTLAVTRLQSLERMEQIKHEWEETFNAIVHPVAVLDERLRLVRGNRALLNGRAPEQVVGRPCFEAVFNRSTACPGCPVMADFIGGKFHHHRSSNDARRATPVRTMQFRVTDSQSNKTDEVSSRPLRRSGSQNGALELGQSESSNDPILVHLYRDATTTVQFEKRIVESSKMAELGTIGSSIAHQLNNPIGGMLSHIQLLLMDLKSIDFEGREDLIAELREMESGTRRCADIVRDLLGFTRRADEDEAHDHELVDIVQQAMKITELQTRSRGIRFRLVTATEEDSQIQIRGRFNLLAQSVRAVLLAMLPSGIRDRNVEIRISKNGDRVETAIGPVSQSASVDQLDLTVAHQILAEHGGELELRLIGQVQQAILSLPVSKVLSP